MRYQDDNQKVYVFTKGHPDELKRICQFYYVGIYKTDTMTTEIKKDFDRDRYNLSDNGNNKVLMFSVREIPWTIYKKT